MNHNALGTSMNTLKRVTCNTPFFSSSPPPAVLVKATTISLLITRLLFLVVVLLSSLRDVRGGEEDVEGEQV